MVPITNAKVASLDPTWGRFVGYSLLFDNPGESFRRVGRFEELRCDVAASAELALYRELSRAVAELRRDDPDAFGLCLLPPSSYHVTFFDGGNQANVEGAHPDCQAALRRLIEGLPDSWDEWHELVSPAVQSSVAIGTSIGVSFRYSHLKCPNNEVMVVALVPSDGASEAILEGLVAERLKLSDHYRSTFDFGAGPRYSPHVSLGYFANQEAGVRASAKIGELDEMLREHTQGLTVRFDSISAYAFTDMATFFRAVDSA